MKLVVTGGAGFLGARLISTLLSDQPPAGFPQFSSIVSVDLAACPVDDTRVQSVIGNIADAAFVNSVITPDVTAIYHLAAVVSGQAEAEFDLLSVLSDMPQRVVGRELLLEQSRDRLSGRGGGDRSIDVLISRLRRKLGAIDGGRDLIRTVRGVGYVFTPSVER